MSIPFVEITEAAREKAVDDDKFYKSFLYFFELIVPPSVVQGSVPVSSFLFPLCLNPTGITMSDPFALEDTPGFDGGLFIEENGIIRRMLHIEGHTGFVPKDNNGLGITLIKPKVSSFNARGGFAPAALSGQRHFQFLQDRVFRNYGDLKRDPSTAKDTQLIFHNVKDGEQWLVAPREFRMDRDSRSPTLYRYSIDLLVVDKGNSNRKLKITVNKSWIDKIKEDTQAARNAINMMAGAVRDVVGVINDLKSVVKNIVSVVNDLSTLLTAATNFVNGVTSFITQPISLLATSIRNIDAALNTVVSSVVAVPDAVIASLRQVQDALNIFGLHPESWAPDPLLKLQRQRQKQELSTGTSAIALSKAVTNPPTSFLQVSKLGTAPMPGDLQKAAGEWGVNRFEPVFNSTITYQILQADTLPSIATKMMGDGRLWRQIAAVNNLKAPFISDQRLPGTKKPGDSLLVPSTNTSPNDNSAIVGLGQSKSQASTDVSNSSMSTTTSSSSDSSTTSSITDNVSAVQVLKTDLMLAPSSSDSLLLDLVIDSDNGKRDAKTVGGISNLIQAMQTRVLTEQGSDILFPTLGVRRLIGLNIPSVDQEIVKLRFSEAITADPRISQITSIFIDDTTSPDTVDVTISASVAGITDAVSITVPGPSFLTA